MPILELANLCRSIGVSLLITFVVIYHVVGFWNIFLILSSISLEKLPMKATESLLPLVNTIESLERTTSILAATACPAWLIAHCINPPRYCNHVLLEPPRGPTTTTHRINNNGVSHDAPDERIANIRRVWMDQVALWMALERFWRAEADYLREMVASWEQQDFWLDHSDGLDEAPRFYERRANLVDIARVRRAALSRIVDDAYARAEATNFFLH